MAMNHQKLKRRIKWMFLIECLLGILVVSTILLITWLHLNL